MEQHNGSIMGWLQAHTQRTLNIRKLESNDLDEVNLKLESVIDSVESVIDPDDYVATHSILLQGQGSVWMNGEEVSLPEPLYEIPYNGEITSIQDGSVMTITTDRATYRFQAE